MMPCVVVARAVKNSEQFVNSFMYVLFALKSNNALPV